MLEAGWLLGGWQGREVEEGGGVRGMVAGAQPTGDKDM